ncbi:cytochrome C oxidase subunit III [Malaciobacter canalis]|jgi:cytochrome c oxidase cbb3-type subunit 3|uniref:Cytochrome c oxidase subunit III n=2 Tax=Malaciobacter TaxID=2321114 RepID=A0AB36ZVF9_9BACT|nr:MULTISPECIES: c-type cytochrome [Malaciobacter]PHO08821.1 cytochrome C oxidase subunit III [Malaciobacter canalis]PPK59620.1 cytochrome c oxidase cbb3-type subunit 3 [Malaciobacter marinus]QEE31878.1 cytochrome c oxidase CcoNOPQ, cbb3-type, membrane-bound monoheme cytochrome c subunit III [Malaciobacter canalis]SKB70654.1 cytochrome c oxidase cbb3-type subunit 3 [Malaciobacter marinus]
MKSMVIGGIILIIALMAGTYFIAGDAFNSDDYINSLTMLGAVAIISITVFVALKYINQIKNDTASGELAEEKWDGIGEYKNPIPTGWGLAFIGTLVWLFWYWSIGYPTNGFSQIGQWNEETIEYNKKFASKWENPSEQTLTAMGESIYLVQCAPCHGIDAEGIEGKAQNLTHRMSKESVEYVIRNGANNLKTDYPGGMPPMMLTEEADIQAVSSYVAGGFKGEQPAAYGVCAGCHGADGKGIAYVGPSIVEYTDALVTSVLNNGKKGAIGMMPSFKGRLNPTQEKALATYIRSLGE